jgi:tartrate dehydratase alpha subunit/fumarate hydratase class I-like protein
VVFHAGELSTGFGEKERNSKELTDGALGEAVAGGFFQESGPGATSVSPDILGMMGKAVGQEDSPAASGMLETLIRNARMASEGRKEVCQSPGIPNYVIELELARGND